MRALIRRLHDWLLGHILDRVFLTAAQQRKIAEDNHRYEAR